MQTAPVILYVGEDPPALSVMTSVKASPLAPGRLLIVRFTVEVTKTFIQSVVVLVNVHVKGWQVVSVFNVNNCVHALQMVVVLLQGLLQTFTVAGGLESNIKGHALLFGVKAILVTLMTIARIRLLIKMDLFFIVFMF